MKTRLPSYLAPLIATLVICFGLSAWAGHVHHGKGSGGTPAAADLLRQAYVTLAAADHDYKGHRIAAMRQIEAAGKALGVNVRGDGKGHVPQIVSDKRLHTAQGLLEQARGGLAGAPLKHVNQAIAQLTTALRIR